MCTKFGENQIKNYPTSREDQVFSLEESHTLSSDMWPLLRDVCACVPHTHTNIHTDDHY